MVVACKFLFLAEIPLLGSRQRDLKIAQIDLSSGLDPKSMCLNTEVSLTLPLHILIIAVTSDTTLLGGTLIMTTS